jgi:hypothetical protein
MTYWKRGMSAWERDVAAVESVIRQATGLRSITKRHGQCYVEFRIRAELAVQAKVAVTVQFGPQSETKLLDGAAT